ARGPRKCQGDPAAADSAASMPRAATPPPLEPRWKRNVADFEPAGLFGPDTNCGVGGAFVSTVKVLLAGVASVFPWASVARTWNVCFPSATPERWKGDVQAVNAEPSNAQANVELASVDTKLKLSVFEFVALGGELVICVSGGVVSCVTWMTTEIESVRPPGSFTVRVAVKLPARE